MKFQFKTNATMKSYNSAKWWIDPSVVPTLLVEADTVKEALSKWRDIVQDKFYVSISKSAMRNKENMYRDNPTPTQVGYVITGKYEFETENCNYALQFIDLWVEILAVSYPDF